MYHVSSCSVTPAENPGEKFLTKFSQLDGGLGPPQFVLHATHVVTEVLLGCILDDDGALDRAPVSRLNNADDGRILCYPDSIELPGEEFDLWN